MTKSVSSTLHFILLAFVGAAFCQCGVSANMLTAAPEDSESVAQTDSDFADNDTLSETSLDFQTDASDDTDSVVSTDTFGEIDSFTETDPDTEAVPPDTETVIDDDTGDDTGDDTNSSEPPDSDTGTEDVSDSDSESFSGTEEDTTTDSEECLRGEVRPPQVLIIGDPWVGNEVAVDKLLQLARENDALPENESYMNLTANGAPIEAIVQQYEGYADDDVKLLIMNGGGINTYLAQSNAVTSGGDQQAINEAISSAASGVIGTFIGFLDDLYTEGRVEHVIYSMYPDVNSTPGIDEMRPGLRDACENSNTPCYFLNLEDFWIHGVHNGSAGDLLPNSAGYELIGEQIWNVMMQNCIAQ